MQETVAAMKEALELENDPVIPTKCRRNFEEAEAITKADIT